MIVKTILVLLFCVTGSHAFAFSKKSGAASPQADQAIEIYNTKYPFGRPPPVTSNRVRFGMPVKDIDGTLVFQKNSTGKRLTDISEAQARASFAELAKNYGPDEALEMVKALPICLSFNKDRFGPSLVAFGNVFGVEAARQMVGRNPGLLAVTPEDAATTNEQTMVFSYLVGYTRPLGPVLLPLLFFFLLSPAIEAWTGIPIRTDFLANFQ
jgi:hypothetical protein